MSQSGYVHLEEDEEPCEVTTNCVGCGQLLDVADRIDGGHVHRGDDLVIVGLCRDCEPNHVDVSQRRGPRLHCKGCYGEWTEADGSMPAACEDDEAEFA